MADVIIDMSSTKPKRKYVRKIGPRRPRTRKVGPKNNPSFNAIASQIEGSRNRGVNNEGRTIVTHLPEAAGVKAVQGVQRLHRMMDKGTAPKKYAGMSKIDAATLFVRGAAKRSTAASRKSARAGLPYRASKPKVNRKMMTMDEKFLARFAKWESNGKMPKKYLGKSADAALTLYNKGRSRRAGHHMV